MAFEVPESQEGMHFDGMILILNFSECFMK